MILVLEKEEKRAGLMGQLIESAGKYEVTTLSSSRNALTHIQANDDVQLIITNTRIQYGEEDGLKFIRMLLLKYQRYNVADIPPVIICSANQQQSTVKMYALQFRELAMVFYVFIRNEELEAGDPKLLDHIEQALAKRRALLEELEAEAKKKGDKTKKGDKAKLKSLVTKALKVPSLPEVAIRVQDALRDPDVTFEKLSQIINTDPPIAANVIKLANSPRYGVSGKVSTIDDACKQVGLTAIGNTVVAAKVFDALSTLPADFDMQKLTRHSFAVGTIARLIARRCHALRSTGKQIQFSGVMFAAGLLHDLGKVLMGLYFTEEAEQIVEEIAKERCTLVQAETTIVGVSHADAGLHAAVTWNFPVNLTNVIGRHHWPLEQILPRLKSQQGKLAQRVIRIADAASYEMGYGMFRSDMQIPEIDDSWFKEMGLNRAEFDKWTPELKEDIVYTLSVMGLS